MQTLEQYINNKYYDNVSEWFTEEVKKSEHINNVSKVLNNKDYLKGIHKVLNREDMTYKGETYNTRKTVFQTAKAIINFFNGYILAKPISLGGSNEKMVKEYNQVYRLGGYDKLNHDILDRLLKLGCTYEYVYYDGSRIKSKLIASEDGYPVYSEDTGEYIGFVEYYTSDSNKVSYWNVYHPNKVEQYSDEGGHIHMVDTKASFGLPIVYENKENISDYNITVLDDIMPLLDEFEDFISKLGDSLYTNSINPILTLTGAMLEMPKGVSADACGFMFNLDNGCEMKYVTASIDYNSVKLYLDNLKQMMYDIAEVPSIIFGQSNVANVSETSIKMMYSKANNKASWYRYVLEEGFNQRHEIIKKILLLQGVSYNAGEYINIEFNYSIPMADTDVVNNLSKQYNDGAMDKQTYIELSPLTKNVDSVMVRLEGVHK
ncbi:phage portal protein [Niameybacter massiliensis]|uniref:Phage portal protein n=1 Tax=Holtiella tumoricola TaxID=3018743 RepID=A0AA42DM68_9FIRM|nr:phage portal protein [Holtiella tumoricola]MDA3731438.1 phage portal protein [Holtiella tumoricola]